MSASPGRGASFFERVVSLFGTQVITLGLGILNSVLLARLLGPAAKGQYTLILLLPSTLMVLVQFGLPSAFGFYAARGQTVGIIRKTLVLSVLLSPAALVAVALLPFLRETFLRILEPSQIIFALCVLPLSLVATMANAIVVARKAVRWYAIMNIGQTALAGILLVLLVGLLGLGIPGAIAGFLMYSFVGSLGLLIGAARSSAATPNPKPLTYRELFRYALPLYPGSLTSFFSYRADVYLLSFLLASPAAPLGYYSLAVGLAELVFYVPNAIANVFFPFVASSSREEADLRLPLVTRVTLLLTATAAIALAPAATLLVRILLPAFLASLPAMYVLLPGVVALSVNNVMSSYLTGVGRTATVSAVNISGLVLNVAVNLVLIPKFGIVGASAASLVSYSATSLLMTVIVARLTQQPFLAFWTPGRSDLAFGVDAVVTFGRDMRARFATRG